MYAPAALRWDRLVAVGIGGTTLASLLLVATGGADFDRYTQWSIALLSQDLWLLRSPVGSPLGIPLSQWSHGPGLVFGVGQLVLGRLVDIRDAALVMGWLGSLVFWWAMVRVLTVAAKGDVRLVWLGLGALFVGTHAGFYSHVHASESVALALVGLVVMMAVERRPSTVSNCALVGSAAALLILTRTYLALYALPALVLLAWHLLTPMRAVREWRRWLALAILTGGPVLAVAQVALVNRWMTGDVTRIAYVYGDDNFRSVDWWQPELWALLAHPWHGLLVYHPLYALGFVALVVGLVTSRDLRARIAIGLAVFAIVVNVYVQAAWVAWWMGDTTFGMRGVAVAGAVVVPALVRVIRGVGTRDMWVRAVWLPLTVVCCGWSFLLLLQGHTQFYEYAHLTAAQWQTLGTLAETRFAAPLVAGGLAMTLLVLSHRTVSTTAKRSVTLDVAVWVLGALSLGYVFSQLPPVSVWLSRRVLPALASIVAMGSAWLLVDVTRQWLGRHEDSEFTSEPMIRWGTVGVFLVGTALFAALAVRTEVRLSAGDVPNRNFRYVGDFYVPSAVLAYRQYTRLPGFDDRREAMRRFLVSQGLDP